LDIHHPVSDSKNRGGGVNMVNAEAWFKLFVRFLHIRVKGYPLQFFGWGYLKQNMTLSVGVFKPFGRFFFKNKPYKVSKICHDF
jgi:hypothetical protein